MNQMRELFEKWAKSECLDTDSVDGFYSDNDTHIAWGSWQAAQSVSVPVVGEVVAWMTECLDGSGCGHHRKLGFKDATNPSFWLTGIVPDNYRVTPLIVQPATSISAAELDALRKDADSLIAAKELLLIWQSWFGSSRNRCDDAGKKLWDRIEAIAGETNHG